ncbi:MAG: hypothetical protein HY681_11890 [Chloroflexi bacterium]|nr:hypothetical protein [Chloroflexota bacterium]
MNKEHQTSIEFVICIRNEGYPVSLERRKLYRIIPDAEAAKRRQLRVVDESGEDYLYPEDLFVRVKLPELIEQAILDAA